ncbi:hypothetical protein IAE22_33055, partial [Bacillus sp. S34]|nr:hypothetical protein [Bacillus sp. S34]
ADEYPEFPLAVSHIDNLSAEDAVTALRARADARRGATVPRVDELERIRRSIDALAADPGWDWNSFASTLIATLVGAGIAGWFTIWVLRGQRRDQYVASIRAAAASCLATLM